MSRQNSSLACEEIKESQESLVDFLPVRHLSISNTANEAEATVPTVKISGSITVSF